MDRYIDFTVEDFVWDTFFRQWVLSPTRETDTIWNDWTESNPEILERIHQAQTIVLSLRLHEAEIGDDEISQVVKQTITKIGQPVADTDQSRYKLPVFSIPWLQFAASVALILLLGWVAYAFLIKKETRQQAATESPMILNEGALTEKINATDKAMTIKLEDGSHITLAPKGKIRYAGKFAEARREVYLEGEAFFEIAKDPDRPFLVYSNGLITKVLGTSFRIKAYDFSDEVTVEVKTGRVSVFAQSDPNVKEKASNRELEGVVLNPNQKIIYARAEVRMVKTLVEKPEIVVSKAETPQFEFEDTPASEVFTTIGKAYGIDILFDEELLKGCPLTATLDNQTLHEKLSIICKAVEANYEIMDGQIVVHSKGCRN
jgi:transmembrane sensor